MKIKKIIIFTLFFVLICFVVSMMYFSIHEQVHVQILKSYNVDSYTKVGLFSAATYPYQEQYEERCDSFCKLANNETDVVGYHIALLIFVIMALFYIREVTR